MSRHSFTHQSRSRWSGLRGWLVATGLILAVFTGIFTFVLGTVAWLALGLVRTLTSPFRSKKRLSRDSGPRSGRVDRPHRAERPARPSNDGLTPEATQKPRVLLGDAQDVDFEEIH